MIRSLLLGLAAALAASLADLPAAEAARGRGCGPAVEEHLAALGIDRNDVERVSIQSRLRFRRGGSQVVGYEAWVDLKSCDEGQLVITMSRQCRQKSAYTTAGCQVPGLAR